MPKWFSEQEKELIGQRLLEQGYKQFSTYGLKKTNVEEIAKAAGISKGAFYSFYESKEALFMDVIEQVEVRVRTQILAVIDQPGPAPRARLVNVLRSAFSIFRGTPILQFFTGSDFDLVLRRIPQEKFQSHLAGDMGFIDEVVARCRQAGIPIQARPEKMLQLLYPIVLAILHEDEWGMAGFPGSIDTLIELIAAYCLGEIELIEEGNLK
jgi:AcrR family transcriptional regulator